jgi:hypothetical protein
MTDSERTLSQALSDLAHHAPSGSAPMGDLLRRGHRRRHTRAAFASAAAVTGVGVLAAVTTGGTHAAPSSHPAAGATSHSPITLSLAAESTDANPFHFSITARTTEIPGGKNSRQTRTSSTMGAFDPSSMHGYTKSSSGMTNAETIQIGDTCYARPAAGAPWLTVACPSTGTPTLAGLSQNPSAALKMLEADGQARNTGQSGSGSGAVDTWKFTITESPQASAGTVGAGYTVTGTASVGIHSGQVTAVDYTLALDPESSGATLPAAAVTSVSITFSDYGAPVNVSAPVAGSTGADAQ